MSQETSNQKDTYLNEMLEIKNYTEFKSQVLKNIPNLKLMAKIFMQEHIKTLTGQNVDADKIYLHFFKWSSPSNKTYNGWEHQEPLRSLTLTELAFKNFNAADRERVENTLNSEYGVYKAGPGEKHYGTENEVRILPSDLRKILEENDFYAQVKNSLNTFWEKHEADMLTLAKATFVSEARRARLEGVLSEDDYKLVMQTMVPHLPLEGPVTIDQLASKIYSQGYVYSLDINGYSANDILRFVKSDGHEILYIPGEKRPFEVFENDTAMRHWIVEQGKDSKKRSKLESHFSLYNRQDGTFYTGVDNGLLNLASGAWGIKEINKDGNYFFAGDALSTVIKQTKQRIFSDADTVIKSNAEVSWAQWLGYARIANQIFGPIIGLVGGAFGAVLATGVFAAQIGMEIHQAVTGDTEEERKEGFWAAGIDIGTTLLFAGFAKFVEVKNELSELSELASVNTEINIDNSAEKQVSGFIKGLNKSISVVKVAEDKNGRDIWMRYDPLTEKVSGRRYYRADDGSDILEPVSPTLHERLNNIRTQGMGGNGSKAASRNMAAENTEPRRRSESSQSVSSSESSLEIEDDSTNGKNISLPLISVNQIALHNSVKLNIFKMCFSNARKICVEANRIVRSLNDTELTEELEKTFGKINFPPEIIDEFRENTKKLSEIFNDYNIAFDNMFVFVSSKSMEEAFHSEQPPKIVYSTSNKLIVINDVFFNLGNGLMEATLISKMSHSEKIKSIEYFTLNNDELLVPSKLMNDLVPLPKLKTTTPDKLRDINSLLFHHLENKELALRHLEPKKDLLPLVFGEEDALNHEPEEAFSKILEDKNLLVKILPKNADSLMQLMLHLLMKNIKFIDNELRIENVEIEETKDLLASPKGRMPIPYLEAVFRPSLEMDIEGPIGDLIPPDGLVIKSGEYYRWSDMEEINPVRLDMIKISLKNSEKICSKVQELVDKMSNEILSVELSDAFDDIVFSPDQVENFRHNIKKLSTLSNLFSKEEYYKRYFCFFSFDDYQFRKGNEFKLPSASLAANQQATAVILINDTLFNSSFYIFTKTIIHEMSHFFGTVDNYYYANPPVNYALEMNDEFDKHIEMIEFYNSEILTNDECFNFGGIDLVQSVFGETNHEISDAFKKLHQNEPLFAKIVTSNADSLAYFIMRFFHEYGLLKLDNINNLLMSEKGQEKFPPLIVGKETSVSNAAIGGHK